MHFPQVFMYRRFHEWKDITINNRVTTFKNREFCRIDSLTCQTLM